MVEFRLVNVNLLRGIAGRRRPGFNSLSESEWLFLFDFWGLVGCCGGGDSGLGAVVDVWALGMGVQHLFFGLVIC